MTGHIVLVGMMGSGKSSVGHALARRLGRRLLDSDEVVEAREGRTVREIFQHDGEAAFRACETAALREALDTAEPAVIAAAGGVVLSAENRRLLHRADATVVWLRADPGELVERALRGEHRPLLDVADPEARLRELAAEREPFYEEIADAVVEVGTPPVDQVVDRVVEIVGP